ncbi:unnamed protein product, partial [Staurois parvus]
ASCDWSQLVTWYKAVANVVNDHSQISQVVSNDVRSVILLTTIHVITNWAISDHMIGTSHRGPVQPIGVLLCPLDTAGTDLGARRSQGACTGNGCKGT